MIIAIAVTTEHIAIIQSVMFGLLFITFTSWQEYSTLEKLKSYVFQENRFSLENFSAEKKCFTDITPDVIPATQFLIPRAGGLAFSAVQSGGNRLPSSRTPWFLLPGRARRRCFSPIGNRRRNKRRTVPKPLSCSWNHLHDVQNQRKNRAHASDGKQHNHSFFVHLTNLRKSFIFEREACVSLLVGCSV